MFYLVYWKVSPRISVGDGRTSKSSMRGTCSGHGKERTRDENEEGDGTGVTSGWGRLDEIPEDVKDVQGPFGIKESRQRNLKDQF